MLFLATAVVLLGTVFLMGGLRPVHHDDSYVLTGVAVILVEATLALVFAPGWIKSVVAKTDKSGWIVIVLRTALITLTAAMPPTIMILFANQALDASPGVTQILPVTGTYSNTHRGSTTYYAVVTATTPSPPLIGFSGDRTDVVLPLSSWRTLVPGHSTMTLKIHPGRFGLPWYDIVGTAI